MAQEIPKTGEYELRIEAEIAHAALEAIEEADEDILEIVGQKVVNVGTDDEQLVVTIRNYNMHAVLEILSEVRDQHEVNLTEFCKEIEEYDRGLLLSILETEAPAEFWREGQFFLDLDHHFQYLGVSCGRCELGKGDCYTHRITFSNETAIKRDDPELPEAARRYAMAQP